MDENSTEEIEEGIRKEERRERRGRGGVLLESCSCSYKGIIEKDRERPGNGNR